MAEKRVQELLCLMQKTLECSICLEMMNNPVSTGCGHQFCRFCLTEFLGRKRQVPCPLCKKPITKRSLMKREELGDMVEGVKNLISAFQKDTGSLFSPPRGQQPGLLPGTPDSIKAKTTTRQNPGKNVVRSNIRRSKRKDIIDTTSIDTSSVNERSSDARHCVKSSRDGEKNNELIEGKSSEEVRQQRLLKCIQEGTLNADDFAEEIDKSNEKEEKEVSRKRKTKTKDTSIGCSERLTGITNVPGKKCGKASNNLINNENENIEKKCSKQVPLKDRITQDENDKLKNTESNSKYENKTNEPLENDEVEMDVDQEVPVLSGNSIAKESESSSGPLFRTPMDPKNSKLSKEGNSLSNTSEDIPKKSLRSIGKKKINELVETDDNDNNSLKLTQEELTVKGKDTSRTYCKKDKDLFVKEKKATRKVAEWLKNIPPVTDNTESDNIEIDQPKGRKQSKRMSKKNIKVREEEEAMGNKLKHLAKHVQDNGKGLLFEADDFETEPEQNAPTDSVSNVNDEGAGFPLESDSKSNEDNNNQDLSDVLVKEEKLVAIEPVRRKRIFKSRTNGSGVKSESDSEKSSMKSSDQVVSVTKMISEQKNTCSDFVKESVVAKSQDLDLPSSDPYEFKSSQNTPLKVTKKKGKGKSGKLVKKIKGKQNTRTENEILTEKSFENIWDKDLIPEKTILKTGRQEEIDKLNACLLQAEDYDLLTCTQEAAESIAKNKETVSETVAQKKVRFTEPVISDFIETGKINIIGYRKAKKELNYLKNKQNIKEEREPVVKKAEENGNGIIKDKECPLGQDIDAAEDGESDDLSEDYRFHDDSSGTDDLDIEPTQDQFEKPNIEIQPEEIKAKLSQEIDKDVKKSVPETPLVPANEDLLNTNVIEETPAIFSVPKFNRNLSKPVGKTRKPKKVKTLPLECVTNTVPETPEIFVVKRHNKFEIMIDENIDKESAKVTKEQKEAFLNKTDVTEFDHALKTNAKIGSKVEGESDETISPDADIAIVQITDKDKSEKYEQMQVDSEMEGLVEKPQELENSDLSLTQNSESLLQTRINSKKTSDTEGERSDKSKPKGDKNPSSQKQIKEKVDIEDNEECSIVHMESSGKSKIKKKRKSFMLNEEEESLDFGSLSACDTTSVSEESEHASKAKRQRVNRLKRSPKTKEKIYDTQKCQNEENSGISCGIDIIPDTMTLKTGDQSVTPMKSSISKRTYVDGVGTKEISKDSENVDENSFQVITLSSKSGSVLSLEGKGSGKESENCLKKTCIDLEAEASNLSLSKISDVVLETEIDNTENKIEKEMKGDIDNCKIDAKISIPDKEKISDPLRSPSMRKKRRSGHSGSVQNSQNTVDRVRHLSGILASPQDSLVLSGGQGSPEDIFKMDPGMPSVDLSPVEQDQNSESLDLGTLVTQDPLMDNVDPKKRTSMNESELNGVAANDLANTNAIHNETEKTVSQSFVFEKGSNLGDKYKEAGLEFDSNTESGEQRQKVSGIRGFAKRKRRSVVEQSSMSCTGTGNAVIAETPQLSSSVKYKSPVVKFSTPKVAKLIQSEIIDNDELNGQDDGSVSSRLSLTSPRGKSKSKFVKNSDVVDNHRETPEKSLGVVNTSKYSPVLLKHRHEKGETHEAKVEVEVVELKNDDDDNYDECMLSPNELPDLENDCEVVNLEDENTDNGGECHKVSRRSKMATPKLILCSPDKGNNDMIDRNYKKTPKRIENEEEFKTVIPETMSIDNDDDYNDDEDNLNVKNHTDNEFIDLEESVKNVQEMGTEGKSYKDDDESISLSTSSEFRMDRSDDKSIKDEALNVISKFDEIVENSIDIRSVTKPKNLKKNRTKQNSDNKENNKKKREQKGVINEQNESFERSRILKEVKHKEAYENLRSIIDNDEADMDNMYSTRLDSSPGSCEELNLDDEPEPVILESDIEEDKDIDKDDVECLDDKADLDEDRKVETGGEMEDEDSDYEVKTKSRKKRVILSDSSSDEEEEGSRHMNLTSSSAFSSQSENLTTQERQSLEKEVERMAREMKAMKEQLRKSKEKSNTKISDDQCVRIDDSDDDVPVIETNDSDIAEEDLFMSPPAIIPGDLEPDNEEPDEPDNEAEPEEFELDNEIEPEEVERDNEAEPEEFEHDNEVEPDKAEPDDEETLDPAIVQDLQNQDEGDLIEESLTLRQESFTIPESDPSQLSVSMLHESDPSKVTHAVMSEAEQIKVTRPVLRDLDTNIIPAPTSDTTRQIGIVVTGLNVSQIQQTKKLAALINAKFFTKFNDSVTHVIVKPADEDDTICDRTLKFFQGIASKCWILNFFWVVDSKQVGHLLPEGPYEIQGDTTNNQAHLGPKRSRLSRDDKLFQKFQISLIGDNTYLSKDSMTDLIETCGGEVVEKLQIGGVRKTQLVISCTDIDDEDEDVQTVVKYAREVYKRSGVVTLTREWILDSLTLYKIQPLQEYLATDISNIKLPKI